MTPTLILTRPEGQNDALPDALRKTDAQAFDVITSPLLQITPIAADPPVSPYAHVIFTSVNGVAQARRLGISHDTTAWCVGARTAAAATDAGFRTQSADRDGAALLDMIVAARPQGGFVHLRGVHARVDFASALAQHNIPCQAIMAYDQITLAPSDAAKTAFAGAKPVIVPLYSPRTTATLLQDLDVVAPTTYVAISAAAAGALGQTMGSKVIVAASPDHAGMLAATYQALATL